MVNDSLLPKNIRQIGDIQGRRKICFEDYVMTYIRKMESREDENFLGVFLGERKKSRDMEYVFIRGIMELPDPARPARKSDESGVPASEQENTQAKTGFWQAFQRRYGMPDEIRDSVGSISETEHSKTERLETEHSKAERSKTEQAKTERSKMEHSKTERLEAERSRMEHSKTERLETERSRTEHSGLAVMSTAKKESTGIGGRAAGKRDISEKDAKLSRERNVSEKGAELTGKRNASSEKSMDLTRQYNTLEKKAKRSTSESGKEPAAKRSALESGKESTAKRNDSESGEGSVAKRNESEKVRESAAPPSDPWERLRREIERNFPDCEIQGCCVIGTYPAGRIDELSAHFPEAGRILYHLQDQEERLYWLDGERYEGISGYFVFYEQNQRMQEVLEETFGEKSVEQEGLPDKAIRSFREKVKVKAEEKSHSFLKLASSFFVVGVLIVGVIVVNRVQDLQLSAGVGQTSQEATADTVQTSQEATADTGQASQEATADTVQTGQETSGTVETDGEDMADDISDDTSGAVREASSGSALIEDNLQTASDEILSGSDAFWADETEATATSGAAETSEATATSGAAETSEATATTGAAETSETTVVTDAMEISEASATTTGAAETSEASATTTGAAETSEATATTDAVETSDAAAVSATSAVSRQLQASYVIREGDTLAGICAKYYGTLDRLEELCEANDIEDADLILPGQKIVLP
ncbi:MAG: LysM peptidoglycan-binding domain-containing protein [Lachnospiraceae bacterium]|nr:LysM peptidoglycan-binding domain-containing protein [Lachnospiraceae bacterium]